MHRELWKKIQNTRRIRWTHEKKTSEYKQMKLINHQNTIIGTIMKDAVSIFNNNSFIT